MILPDTSIWINHLRANEPQLVVLLNDNQVLMHAMVIGELACGNLRDRGQTLRFLSGLPRLPSVSDREALFFIERHQLMGSGIGYVDAHLLAAVMRVESARLWTADRRLSDIATSLGIGYQTA